MPEPPPPAAAAGAAPPIKRASPDGATGWRPATSSSEPEPPLPRAPKPLPTERPERETPTPKPPRTVATPKRAPTDARPITNLTPTGSAAGGQGPDASRSAINQVLMLFGLVAVAAGGSWGFYYFLKPPKD
jgi:hypothetical protein